MLTLALLFSTAAFAVNPAVCAVTRHRVCTQAMVHYEICPAQHEAEHLFSLQQDIGMLCRQKTELRSALYDLSRATAAGGNVRASLPCCESVSSLCYVEKELADEKAALRAAQAEVRAKAAAAAGGQAKAFSAVKAVVETSKRKLGEIQTRLERLQQIVGREQARLTALRADQNARYQRVAPFTQGNFCGDLLPKIRPVMEKAAAEVDGLEAEARQASGEVATELRAVQNAISALDEMKAPAAKNKR